MRKRMRVTVLFLMVVALALVASAGCTPGGNQGARQDGAGKAGGRTAVTSMTIEIVKQWATSRHSLIVTRAAGEEGCKNCHDGLTFTTTGGGFQPRRTEATGSASATAAPDASTPGLDEGGGESVRDFMVGTDCRACHTGAGAAIADAGSVDKIPSLDTAKGGLGAVCMACHNGWHPGGKSAEGELTAPHTSVQTDMLFAVNTVDPGGPSTAGATGQKSPHLKVENTCVGCHVTGSGAAGPNHTFRVKDFKGCERKDCHKQDMTQGGTAKKDYDGDGTKEKVVAEIEGLTKALQAAIEAKAGKFESSHGQVVLASKAKPDDATYAAAYNYFFVQKDGSRGVHNTGFTVDLLTRSIRSVGGTVGTGAGGSSTTTP